MGSGFNKDERVIEFMKYELEETKALIGIEIANMLDLQIESTSVKDLGKRGDYTSNIAFRLAPILKKSPQEVATEICKRISSKRIFEWYWDRAEAKNGFINLYLSKEVLVANMNKINDRTSKD